MRRLSRRAEAEGRLDALLEAWLPELLGHPVSRSAIRRLVMAGAVDVAGRVCRRPGQAVAAGARVDALLDEARLAPVRAPAVAILFEDRWLVAADKPAGLAAHASADPHRPDLVSELARLLERREGAPVRLRLHQRLDIGTSGVLLLSRDDDADRGLARDFEGRQVEKVYLALTARPARLPASDFVVDAPLSRGDGPGQRGGRAVTGSGGQPALTRVRVREVLARALLLEARPHTGRRHQVRAHLACAGLPILGDAVYAPAAVARAAKRPLLHAASLRLTHPVTGQPLLIESPLPPDFVAAIESARRR